MSGDELAIVYTTTHTAGAEVVRLALEEEGLAAFVDGAQQAGFSGVLDVHVRVPQPDAERARRVIDEMRRPAATEEDSREALGESADNADQE